MKLSSSILQILRRRSARSQAQGPTTAEQLVARFDRRGIPRAAITSEHVRPYYRRLRRTSGAADFAGVAPLLESLAPNTSMPPTPVTGVIVETRRHPNLGAVVRAFHSQLRIPIQIFHGEGNRDFVRATLCGAEADAITFCQLPVDDLPAQLYNALLLSEKFWLSFTGREKILIFQSDALCCGGSDYQLSDFMAFDYIGSMWHRDRPVGIIADGGNGGLSLRDWQASVDCLRRFPPRAWPGGEDGYFVFHMDIAGMRVGDREACARFSTQQRFLKRSWGVHNPVALSKEEQAQLLAYCPEVGILLR